jgi:hypothetical protein
MNSCTAFRSGETAQLPAQFSDFQKRDFQYAGRNQEYLDWLLTELQAHSQEDRNLLIWRAQDIPYADIAQWLGINDNAARVRHKRVMDRLLAKAKDLETLKGAAQP